MTVATDYDWNVTPHDVAVDDSGKEIQERESDEMALIHELGHAVEAYFSKYSEGDGLGTENKCRAELGMKKRTGSDHK